MNNRSKRLLIFVLILSAALHFLAFVFFLLYKQDENRSYKPKLSPGKSAKVIFKKPTPKKIPPKKTPKKRLIPKLSAGDPTTQIAVMPKPQPTEEKKTPSPKPELEPEKKIEPQKTVTYTKNDQKKKQTAPRETAIKQAYQKEPPKPQQKVKQTKQEKKEPVKATAKKQKKLTLADITRRFLSTAHKNPALFNNNSNHLVKVIGGKRAQATEQQLKHERYVKKLFDCMNIVGKMHLRTLKFTQRPDEDVLRVKVLMDLHKNGHLALVTIVKSSGNLQYDQFIIKVIRDSARSFPPVPSYFNTDLYSVPFWYDLPVAATMPQRQHRFA